MSRTAFRADAPLSAAAKSPDDILVRAMGTDDLPHVAAIEAQSQRDPWPQPSFQAELENPEVWLPLVAVRKKEIVGYVVPWFVADEVQIANIGVKEEHRRQGLGRFLLSLVLQRAEQRRIGGGHASSRCAVKSPGIGDHVGHIIGCAGVSIGIQRPLECSGG